MNERTAGQVSYADSVTRFAATPVTICRGSPWVEFWTMERNLFEREHAAELVSAFG